MHCHNFKYESSFHIVKQTKTNMSLSFFMNASSSVNLRGDKNFTTLAYLYIYYTVSTDLFDIKI